MPTQYDDIYVRDNFGDTGVVPSNGVPYQSPDIVRYQNQILTWPLVSSSYSGSDIGKAIVAPGQNNIYVRAKNLLQTGTETGSVALSYAKASLLLLPNQWTAVQTAGGAGSVPFVNQSGATNLNPNDVALSQQAFLLTNLPPAGGDHYCMIAIVTTPLHTVQFPRVSPRMQLLRIGCRTTPPSGGATLRLCLTLRCRLLLRTSLAM